jgi:hypothetical protein
MFISRAGLTPICLKQVSVKANSNVIFSACPGEWHRGCSYAASRQSLLGESGHYPLNVSLGEAPERT